MITERNKVPFCILSLKRNNNEQIQSNLCFKKCYDYVTDMKLGNLEYKCSVLLIFN